MIHLHVFTMLLFLCKKASLGQVFSADDRESSTALIVDLDLILGERSRQGDVWILDSYKFTFFHAQENCFES